MTTSADLAHEILQYIHDTVSGAIERYMPDLRLPNYFAGQRIAQEFAVDLCVCLSLLHRAGYASAGRWVIVDAIRAILPQLDGSTIKTFYSYRLAEVLLAYGGVKGNPLLEGFSEQQVNELIAATDSTSIFDTDKQQLRSHPNNYWCVLARCEHARSMLGVLRDDYIYRIALERTRSLLFKNPLGFFDDDVAGGGRYDIYSADSVLFVEPMWELLGKENILKLLDAHVRLLESIAMPNGAMVAWGRSIGVLSVWLAAEMAAAGVVNGLGDRNRLLNLAKNSFDRFRSEWMREHLIDAHRGRMTEGYRGPARLLQMTFDGLEKWAWVALQLREVEAGIEPMPQKDLFPPRDEFTKFDERGAGVWMFRNRVVELQLPVVGARNSDYVTWAHSPGLFENPVESQILIGVPRVQVDGKDFAPLQLPGRVEHGENTLRVARQKFSVMATKEPSDESIGDRAATWRVEGDKLVIDERWRFDRPPEALTYAIAEAGTRLKVEWETSAPHSRAIVDVENMHGYDTVWGTLKRLHEIDFSTERTPHGRDARVTDVHNRDTGVSPVPGGSELVELKITITPAIPVAHGPCDHDYNRGMYDRMPEPGVMEFGFRNGLTAGDVDGFLDKVERAGLLHIGWPEHLLANTTTHEEMLLMHERIARQIRSTGAKVAWTMHNRRPHKWPAEMGRELYRLWAPITDAALHHSAWGRDVMRSEYPFKPTCRHEVIPHGHFGHQMKLAMTREGLEEKYKLPRCAMRFGVLGRYQPEKQIELMLEAFHRAGRADQQLVLSAYDVNTVIPDDPRIIKLPREKWQTRTEIAEHAWLCDAMIAAQTGDTYLTSGMVGDAFGVRAGMIVPEWAFYREIAQESALYHDNTVDGLAELLRKVSVEQINSSREASKKLQSRYDWVNLSPRVYSILRELLC